MGWAGRGYGVMSCEVRASHNKFFKRKPKGKANSMFEQILKKAQALVLIFRQLVETRFRWVPLTNVLPI